ncbi:glycosyltransferase [Nesterenkonia ebinurensis]|uniref:glycosyltransferase n=1 Tax=Nesterenkonia ebinurensis TaxID=2608252 RepID=UPI001CC7FDDE|nr:glycosyltransferase [Nesterenkonia ebinurensis]
MRICLIASSQFPIAEPFAGGLEAHTHAMARALTRRGHEITLFAAAGSDPQLGARAILPQAFSSSEAARRDLSAAPDQWMSQHHAYLGLMLKLARERRFTVIHNNCLHHLPLAMSELLPAPLVTTLHTPPTPWLESAARYAASSSSFAAVSRATAEAWRHSVRARVIPNGVDISQWPAGPGGKSAVWSGRIAPEKAPHLAIDAAHAAGMSIALAGPVMDASYFEQQLLPRLGSDAIYHGHLRHRELTELVGAAAVAVVSPQWEEPYGLVAAEAMACGTPVAAFRRGGLAEIVTPASGALAAEDSVPALTEAILQARGLSRAEVRSYAAAELSLDRMVSDYEQLYEAIA